MSIIFVSDYIFLLPFVTFLSNLWFFFFKNNNLNFKLKTIKTDKLNKKFIIKKLNYNLILKYVLFLNFFLFLNLLFIKGYESSFFWNHCYINNFILNVYIILISINALLWLGIFFLSKSNINYNSDYFFALSNITVFLFLIFLANNFLTFFFFLEVISTLIFYKFSISKIWFTSNNVKTNDNKNYFINRFLPKTYLNTLYFQYWSTFLSSVLIIISIINLYLVFGSLDFFVINFLLITNNNIMYLKNFKLIFMVILPLLLGVFIKLGLTPFHLFKLEVYKGLPLISIYFYTTYYFLSYVILLSIIFLNIMSSLLFYWWFLFFVALLLGSFYIINLVFDVNLVKVFFGYSTIINSFNFFLFILIIFLN